jgi:hypothetical protein
MSHKSYAAARAATGLDVEAIGIGHARERMAAALG